MYTLDQVKRIASKAYIINPNPDNLLSDFETWFNNNLPN